MKRPVPVLPGVVGVIILAWLAGGACLQPTNTGAGGMGGTGGRADSVGAGAGTTASGGATSSGGSLYASGGGAGGTAGGAGGAPAAAGGTSGSGGSSSTLANFATVHDIVFTLCGGSGCHQPGDTPPTLLDDAHLYSTLLTYVSTYCGDRVLVKPGSPQESAFYLAQSGRCGNSLPKMPLGCVDNCTPPDYLDGVSQWIENGAPEQ
jgi:hypothetical protein